MMQTGIRVRGDQFVWVCQEENCFFYGYEATWEAANYALEQMLKSGTDLKTAAGTDDCTLNEYFQHYIEKKQGVREATLLKYRQLYSSFVEDRLGNDRIHDITVEKLEELLSALVYSETSPITVGMVRSLLSNMFKAAKKERVIDSDPMLLVEVPRNRKQAHERTPFTDEELDDLISRVQRDDYLTIIRLGAWTGMRAGEILGLQAEDIDRRRGIIRVRHSLSIVQGNILLEEPKTLAGKRSVPVSNKCLRMLKHYMDSDEARRRRELAPEAYKNYVFLSKKGFPICGTAVANYLKIIVTNMKQEQALAEDGNYSFHSLRHTFATRCLVKGMKPKVLATILGHSSTKVTLEVYTHICEDDEKNEMKSLGLI